jgi:flavin-dependent dehydrogenase
VKIEPRYDVVIAGGGLAGLCLGIQLRRAREDLRVLVVEPNEWPLPEAAHKVGESSVESASHYFLKTLGLARLLEDELPKFGLRFFMSHGDNRSIEDRLECGPSHYLYVPSFQIDRGQFETQLAERAAAEGVVLASGARVSDVEIGTGQTDHRVLVKQAGATRDITARWIVDASGRSGLLRKQFESGRPSRHRCNSAWFRIDAEIDVEEWSTDAAWLARTKEPRRLSTNHLMGEGYWVWLIPLAKGRTSIGIVADAQRHDFAGVSNFDKAFHWIEAHEPQLADVLRKQLATRLDFRAMKHCAHEIEGVFGSDRWAITGEAGLFIDPLYSPGSDFIGMANTLVTELILRDHAGESIDKLTEVYDRLYRSLARTFLVTYHRQYSLMGNARVMSFKIVWDFVMYWGGPALIFCRDRLTDPGFMDRARPILERFALVNVRMQAFFRDWHAACEDDPPPPQKVFVDYAELAFLAELNRALLIEENDDDTLRALERNVELALTLRREIVSAVARHNAKVSRSTEEVSTNHLKAVIDVLYPSLGR